MSWVKSIPQSGDDVFDEDEDSMNLQSKEWKSNMEKRVKEGYRDGIDAGKEASLQRGFNAGYRQGAKKMTFIGQLKGTVSAIHYWCQHRQINLLSVSQLLQDVMKHEEMMMESIQTPQLQPQAALEDITDRVEDLGMRLLDSECAGAMCAANSCCMGAGAEKEVSVPTFPTSTCYSSRVEGRLEQLIIRCVNLVSELGLPNEISHHLKEIMTH